MKTNPLLEKLWRVKDDLAREAGFDIDRIFDKLRCAEARQTGSLVRSADELRRYAKDLERQHDVVSAIALKEKCPETPPERHE